MYTCPGNLLRGYKHLSTFQRICISASLVTFWHFRGIFHLLSLLTPYLISFSICSSSSPLLFLTSMNFCYCYDDSYIPLIKIKLTNASEKWVLLHVCAWWLMWLPHTDSTRTTTLQTPPQTTTTNFHCSLFSLCFSSYFSCFFSPLLGFRGKHLLSTDTCSIS